MPASVCLRSTAFSAAAGSRSLKSTRRSYFLSSSSRRTTCVMSPAVPMADAKVSAPGAAAARPDAVDRAARLPMSTRADARPEQLQITADGGANRAARRWIHVLHQDVVEGILLLLGATEQRGIGLAPRMEDVASRRPLDHLSLFGIRLVGEVLQEAHDLPVEDVH